jgi:phage terminase small subunit
MVQGELCPADEPTEGETTMPIKRKIKIAPPRPPSHLKPCEAAMWRKLVAEHEFGDVASLALLKTALESHQRARLSREQIDEEGATVGDRFGQLKSHPLLAAERDARSSFIGALKALNLDLTGVQ